MWVELTVLLLCILIGARWGASASGTVSGIGLLVFVFVFRMPPGGGSGNKMWLVLQSAHQMGSQPTFLQTDLVADSGLP